MHCCSLRPLDAFRPPTSSALRGVSPFGRYCPLSRCDPRYAADLVHSYRLGEEEIAQRLGVLGILLDRRSGFAIINEVSLYKQIILPIMDYACTLWRSAAVTRVRKLQVLQTKCLSIATKDLGTFLTANSIWFVSSSLYWPYQISHKEIGLKVSSFREVLS